MKTVALIILLSGQSADYATSIGRYESNPLLRGSNGQFSSRRAIPIKIGVVAGLLVLERKTPLRHHPRFEGGVNLAVGSAMWAQLGYNLSVAKRSPEGH